MSPKPGYKQTEVGVIPEDWKIATLSDLSVSIQNGVFYKPSLKGVGVKLINVGDLYTRTPIDSNALELFDASQKECERFKVEDGDLFFTRSSIVPSGIAHCNIYRAPKHEPVVFDSHVIRLRPDTGKVAPSYLFRFCVASVARRYLVSHAKTATMTTIDQGVLGKCPIFLPPKDEQEAIATALSDVDALLAAQDKLIAKKRDIKQAAMQQLLTGKQRLPGFTGEWEVKPLENICWYQEGPGVRNYQFTRQGVKLLNGTNIANGRVVLDTTDRYISEAEAFGCYKHFLVDDGDILIASSGVTIDKFHEKVAFASSDNLPLCMNTSTIRFKTKPSELLDKYLFFYLQSDLFKEPIGKQATGSAQLNFGPAHLKKINLSLPPTLEEQAAIATVLSDMNADITSLEKQRDKTRALKQGMMQDLLTGRIRLT